jgi:hypothetical protein
MFRYFPFLLLPFLLFSCGETKNQNNSDTVVAKTIDVFREDVLKIRRAGLLKKFNDHQLDSLIEVYRGNRENGMEEILTLSGDLLNVHSDLNGRKVQEVIAAICDTIGQRWPDLKSDEVKVSLVPSEPGKKDTDAVLLQVRFGKNWRERSLYYFESWPVDELLYSLYNTMLTDSGSGERLTFVQFICTNCPNQNEDDFRGQTDINRFGYMRLTKAQQDTLLTIQGLLDPEDEFSILSTKQVDEKLKQFESSGLIGDKDQKWYGKIKQDIRRASVYGMEDLYNFLDTLFCVVSFDTTNDYNPYGDILINMKKASRGKFMPPGYSDEELNLSTRTVRFTLNDKVYERDIQRRFGLYSPEIIEMVNEALADQKIGGAYYTILTRENRVLMVYIEDSNADKAMLCGFFEELTKGVSEKMKTDYAGLPSY